MATGSSTLSAHGHKILLAFAVVALLATAGLVFLRLQAPAEDVTATSTAGKPYTPRGTAELEKEFKDLSTAYQLVNTNLNALVSEIRVSCTNVDKTLLPWSAETCWKCGSRQPKRGAKTDTDGDGIPDVVEIANGMDPNKNDIAEDLDKDGFSNGEEIAAITKPNDVASHPPRLGKLRVAKIGDSPIIFMLKETTSAGGIYRLQVSIAGVEKLSAKLGETVNGWVLKSYDEPNKTLMITKGTETFQLPRGKRVEKNQRVVLVGSLIDPSFKVTVKTGETFKLDGVDHLVLEIRENAAVVRGVGSDQSVTIPVATPKEMEDIKASRSGQPGSSGGTNSGAVGDER